MSNPIAKLRVWTMLVAGVSKQIAVLSTDVPDLIQGGGGGLSAFVVSALHGDYMEAVGGGQNVLIAKPFHFRQSTAVAGETIDGVATTYTWSNDNVRIATDSGGNSESQFCTPRYTVGMTVFAMNASSTGVPPVAGRPVVLIEVLPSRQWGGQN